MGYTVRLVVWKEVRGRTNADVSSKPVLWLDFYSVSNKMGYWFFQYTTIDNNAINISVSSSFRIFLLLRSAHFLPSHHPFYLGVPVLNISSGVISLQVEPWGESKWNMLYKNIFKIQQLPKILTSLSLDIFPPTTLIEYTLNPDLNINAKLSWERHGMFQMHACISNWKIMHNTNRWKSDMQPWEILLCFLVHLEIASRLRETCKVVQIVQNTQDFTKNLKECQGHCKRLFFGSAKC